MKRPAAARSINITAHSYSRTLTCLEATPSLAFATAVTRAIATLRIQANGEMLRWVVWAAAACAIATSATDVEVTTADVVVMTHSASPRIAHFFIVDFVLVGGAQSRLGWYLHSPGTRDRAAAPLTVVIVHHNLTAVIDAIGPALPLGCTVDDATRHDEGALS